MHPYNFGTDGNIPMKLFQAMWRKAGVITCVQFSEGRPPKIWEGKNVQISVRFLTNFDFTSKFRFDFWQISTLIANISGTGRHIEHPKSSWTTAAPPTLDKRNLVNFGIYTKKLQRYILSHPSGHFSGHNMSALKRCCVLKFLHAIQIDQGYIAHTPNWDGVPPSPPKKNLIAKI